MRDLILILAAVIAAHVCVSQTITYAPTIDSSDHPTFEVMTLFENYLASHPERQEENPYWNSADQERYAEYDFLANEFQPSLYMGLPAQVLDIRFEGEIGFIKVRYGTTHADGSPNTLAVVNYVAQKEDGAYKLGNALMHNRLQWNHRRYGYVDFYFPPYHSFHPDKAQQLNDFIVISCAQFDVPPRRMEYYLANTYDELQQLKGLDEYVGKNPSTLPSGKASENKVYCAGLGEFYPHEVVHVQIDPHYPNKHWWVSEGLATFLGGSRGYPLDWHLEKTAAYLADHPEINLNNLLEFSNLDSVTAYHYALGGWIVRKVFEKKGFEGLKAFMNSGPTKAEYYAAVEHWLGVSQDQLDVYLRRELQAFLTD